MLISSDHCFSIINTDQASGKKSLWKLPIDEFKADSLSLPDFVEEINSFLLKNSTFIFENLKIDKTLYEKDLDITKPVSYYLDCLPFYTTSYCVNREIEVAIHDFFNHNLIMNVRISPNQTIFDLKNKIKTTNSIFLENQMLFHCHYDINGPLSDAQTLKSLGVKQGQKLYLVFLPKFFFVRWHADPKIHTIGPVYSNAELLLKISQKFEIIQTNLIIFHTDEFQGQRRVGKNNFFQLKENDVLTVYPPLKETIDIQVRGRIFSISPYLNLSLFQELLAQEFQIPIERQCLQCGPSILGKDLPIAEIYEDLACFFPEFKLIDRDGFFRIFIKSFHHELLELQVLLSYTVSDIKTKIQELHGVAADQQKLLFAGNEMENRNTLKDHNVCPEATIVCLLKTNEGEHGCFCPLQEIDHSQAEAKIQIQWSNKAPQWRKTIPGLSLEGVCQNIECQAFKSAVLINFGLGCFDVILERERSICPMCNSYVVPTNCGFNNCSFRMTGIKITENGVERQKFQMEKWEKAGNYYQTYNNKKTGSVKWLNLKFHTSRCQEQIECAICLWPCQEKLGCGHSNHPNCLEKLENANGFQERTCPQCLGVVYY